MKANRFNFGFFLSSRKEVVSLEDGAKLYGGATRVKDSIYSNYMDTDRIQVNEDNNELSIFIPSTIDVNRKVDNSQYVEKYLSLMSKRFDNIEVVTDCKGSWYSEDLDKVILEDIVIIKAYVKEVSVNDIEYMQVLAQEVKHDMSQEGVTITINDSLAIV